MSGAAGERDPRRPPGFGEAGTAAGGGAASEAGASSRAWTLFSSGVCMQLAALCLLALALVITYDVIGRYFLGAPTRWAFEASKYLLALTVMLGAAHALLAGAHIRIEILYERLSRRGRLRCDVAALLVGAVFCGLLTWLAAGFAMRSFNTGTASLDLGIPLWLPQSLVPIGAGMLAVECLRSALAAWRRLSRP